MQAGIKTNENIKNQIEISLQKNTEIQQQYLELVMKLQNHQKKDVLELQIAARTLKLERMDLTMQNLEIQKLKRIVDLENKGKGIELAKIKEELERVKEDVKNKEAQLAAARSGGSLLPRFSLSCWLTFGSLLPVNECDMMLHTGHHTRDRPRLIMTRVTTLAT